MEVIHPTRRDSVTYVVFYPWLTECGTMPFPIKPKHHCLQDSFHIYNVNAQGVRKEIVYLWR